ncbi:hypothetical protein, partial [Peribacillus sp. NPDC058002]|uniref:hypothetical protein n=1 Tax=Peribacillus sp. NPDC058002 TaxID=3346301 RepID=UPI0036DA2B3B
LKYFSLISVIILQYSSKKQQVWKSQTSLTSNNNYFNFLRRLLKTFIKIVPSSVLKNLTPTNFKGVHISLIWYKGIKNHPFFCNLLIELLLLK